MFDIKAIVKRVEDSTLRKLPPKIQGDLSSVRPESIESDIKGIIQKYTMEHFQKETGFTQEQFHQDMKLQGVVEGVDFSESLEAFLNANSSELSTTDFKNQVGVDSIQPSDIQRDPFPTDFTTEVAETSKLNTDELQKEQQAKMLEDLPDWMKPIVEKTMVSPEETAKGKKDKGGLISNYFKFRKDWKSINLVNTADQHFGFSKELAKFDKSTVPYFGKWMENNSKITDFISNEIGTAQKNALNTKIKASINKHIFNKLDAGVNKATWGLVKKGAGFVLKRGG